SALEALYLVLLATGYSVAAMGFVYPIARGSAPVVVLVISVIALGVSVSAVAAAGVLLVGTGVLLVGGPGPAGQRRALARARAAAAVRESSGVIATVALASGSREDVTAQRLAGAVVVVAGIALISLG